MANTIKPIQENENIGFHYTVTEEQIEAYSKWTIEEKLMWIENTAKFIYAAQTPEERLFSRQIKGKEKGVKSF